MNIEIKDNIIQGGMIRGLLISDVSERNNPNSDIDEAYAISMQDS